MTTAVLTPTSNTTPVTVNILNELSGVLWVNRFPGSSTTDALTSEFRDGCDAFIAAIRAGHGQVHVDATYRPPERAYMMHWAHRIYRNDFPAVDVPPMGGVHINWVHPTPEQSKEAARVMCVGFALALSANTAPALDTLHTQRKAIDMRISWPANLTVSSKDGTVTTITTLPRTGMNAQLKEVGRSYGVIKFVGGDADRPHWSTTGH